jgi:23S rRNA (uridine2552-2'-O)-methyltransferase
VARSRRPQDHWGQRAKREGFPARSVYKLEEIDRRTGLLRARMRVLDLGACPGSWTSYAAQKVGPHGRVLGLDLQPHRGALPPNAEIRRQDVMAPELEVQLGSERFDVVMSDMAPATSGNRFVDQARSFQLVMRALQIADRVLVPGGHFVAKIFQGPDFEEARRQIAQRFEETKIVKPSASRTESIEVFLVGLRKRK